MRWLASFEFTLVQRHYPIVFSIGDKPIPIALMGLNEGVNVFVGDDGKLTDTNVYVPAYVRRYPFMLAKLHPDAQEMSLCFDPTADTLGAFDEGQPLFEGAQPSQTTKDILSFNEQFEQAGQRTQMFMAELRKSGLLMDGEVAIQPEGFDQPFVYRGFQMIDEEKFRAFQLDGNVASWRRPAMRGLGFQPESWRRLASTWGSPLVPAAARRG